jgi:putative DNA primase/helicase
MNIPTETPQEAARRLAAKPIGEGFHPQALHTYTAPTGDPLYWRIRLKHPETGHKWIRPMWLNHRGYTLGEPDFPNGKPLYRWHELAARPDQPVMVVEGEWCADALADMGVLATTSGAADSAERADWQPLAGRRVTLWPDNDEPGQRYSRVVAGRLQGLRCQAHIIDVAALNLPPKTDAVDWLAAHPGATAEDVNQLPVIADPETTEPPSTDNETDQQTIERLAALSPLDYDRVRQTEAERLGVRLTILDKQVAATRRATADAAVGFEDMTPWPDPIDPALLLTDITDTVRRFIVCQAETAHAVALWAAMTWFMDVAPIAPLAVITAPEKRCGKSQLLFVLGKLVKRPLTASNITPAALFRSIDTWEPTLLVDEADAFMRENEELRGLLNCGHTRDSAYIVRVVGENLTPTVFNVWGAKALAGIGHLADTLMDRAVTLELRRKLPHESVERLRYAEPGLFDTLAAKLARFAVDYREVVRLRRPMLPDNLNDRAQDNWEPLLAIAEVAGNNWPELGQAAALKLSGAIDSHLTLGTELLADIKQVFETKNVDRMSTIELIEALCADDEQPWATYNRGKPITPRQVNKRLNDYEIKRQTIRIGYKTVKGFLIEQFDDAFARYLPSQEMGNTVTNHPKPSENADFRVTHRDCVTETCADKPETTPLQIHRDGQGMIKIEI